MKTKPKWVIFDVGHVLYDYDSFVKSVCEYLNIEYILLKQEMDGVVANSMTGELTFEQVWTQVLRTQKRENELAKIVEFFWDPEKFLKDTKLLLKQLDQKGYSIALFTNNWPGMRKWMVRNIDEGSFMIKHIFESAAEHLRKPDIRFYNLVEKKTKAKGNKIYFIDDLEENIETGKMMGWQTFLYDLGQDGGKTSNDKIRKQLL